MTQNRSHRPGFLSERALNRMRIGSFRSESLGYGRGSLEARRTKAGIRFYYRHGADQTRVPIPPQGAQSDLTLDEARERALALSAQERPDAPAGGRGLGDMLSAYCDYLAANEKASAADVRSLFGRHVKKAHPGLWSSEARAIGPKDIVSIIEPVVEAGHLPTAVKLRSALHAAFGAALDADFNAQMPTLRGVGLTHNPVSRVGKIDAGPQVGDRALSIRELQAYWRRLLETDGAIGALLRVHLVTGAQRPTQLVRAIDRDLSPQGLLLQGSKGRRSAPRPHLVPLIWQAKKDLVSMNAGEGPYLFTLDGGESPAHRSTIHKHVSRIAKRMVAAGEADEPFTVADLRRTVETRLAEAKVSKEVRSHLHSHDLSGIQDRHYSRYDFLAEKTEALETLWSLIGGEEQADADGEIEAA